MCASGIWRVLCVLACVVASVCVNEVEYEGNEADSYGNEISQDQQEGVSPATPCQAADFSRWDKLFIALEDSHMRQNMLMESLESCCGRMVPPGARMEQLAKGACQQCLPSLESACHRQAEQARLKLQRGLSELREEGAERERRLNDTLQMLLLGALEDKARLRQQEDGGAHRTVTGQRPTPGPGGLGAAFGAKPLASGLKEQEVASPLDMGTVERSLVAIATELQKVHLQLSRVIEQAGTLKKDRGDT